MKKILKKIILSLVALLSLNNLQAEQIEMNLIDFAIYTSEANNVNILIDDDLREQNIVFIVNNQEHYYLEVFRKAVNLKGLELVQTDKFYYVKKKDVYLEQVKYRPIKLNFVKFEDIQNFLKVYDSIKYEFISTSKTLLIASKEEEFVSIKNMIEAIDTLPKQLKLKVTILDTNLEKLKELGSDSSSINFQNDGNFFFNLVSYPFIVKNQVPNTQKDNFYTFLKYLSETGTSEFVSNPILTLNDGTSTDFDVGNRLPSQVGSVTIDENTSKSINSVEYINVGTNIKIFPRVYGDDNVYLDIDFNVSNIVSNTNNFVNSSFKHFKQSFNMQVGQLHVLTGINKRELKTSNTEIPILSNIPFLGWLFKYESNSETINNLTIVFELINEKDFDTKNFNVLVPNKIEG